MTSNAPKIQFPRKKALKTVERNKKMSYDKLIIHSRLNPFMSFQQKRNEFSHHYSSQVIFRVNKNATTVRDIARPYPTCETINFFFSWYNKFSCDVVFVRCCCVSFIYFFCCCFEKSGTRTPKRQNYYMCSSRLISGDNKFCV